MSLLQIESGLRPCHYGLSVSPDCRNLIVSVQDQVFSEFTKIVSRKPEPPLLKYFADELQLPQFLAPTDKWLWWGFGPVATQEQSSGGFIDLKIVLPRIIRYPPGYEEAKFRGLEKEPWEYGYENSLWQPDVDWRFAFGVSATLTTLFRGLSVLDTQQDSNRTQLVEINMDTGISSNHLSVTLGRALLPYLNKQPDNSHHQKAEKVMKESYEYMMGKQDFPSIDRFEVWFREKHWVNLLVPGNACGLDPEGYHKTDSGYTIYPHNVDSVAQQLTLLMGIASLHQEARDLGF